MSSRFSLTDHVKACGYQSVQAAPAPGGARQGVSEKGQLTGSVFKRGSNRHAVKSSALKPDLPGGDVLESFDEWSSRRKILRTCTVSPVSSPIPNGVLMHGKAFRQRREFPSTVPSSRSRLLCYSSRRRKILASRRARAQQPTDLVHPGKFQRQRKNLGHERDIATATRS